MSRLYIIDKMFVYDFCGLENSKEDVYVGFNYKNVKENYIELNTDNKPLDYYFLCYGLSEDYTYENRLECLKMLVRENWDRIITIIDIVNMYDIKNGYNLSYLELACKVLKPNKVKYYDDYDIILPDNLTIKKYTQAIEHFKHLTKDSEPLDIMIANVPHRIGCGGVHGAIKNYSGSGYFVMIDANSMYPVTVLNNKLLSRGCEIAKYSDLVKKRLHFKMNFDPRNKSLKNVINIVTGAMKYKYCDLYDVRMNNSLVVTCQLYLINLIEMIENECKLIQTNTDGILVKLNAENDFEAQREYHKIKKICDDWSKNISHLSLTYDGYVKVHQKDVNNYIAISKNGNYKAKGLYLKDLKAIDGQPVIVTEALHNYFVNDVPIEEHILSCNNPIKFQIVKAPNENYNFFELGEDIFLGAVRFFASANTMQSIRKKGKNKSYQKVENSPQWVFADNGKIEKVDISKIDKEWYIELAYKRKKEIENG